MPGWALQGVVGYARAGAPGLVVGLGWLGTFAGTLTQGPRTFGARTGHLDFSQRASNLQEVELGASHEQTSSILTSHIHISITIYPWLVDQLVKRLFSG